MTELFLQLQHGHAKQVNNSRLPAKALEILVSGTRSRGRQNKTWIDNVKEDLQQRGSDMQPGSRTYQRQEAMEELCPCSPIVGNLWVKMDGSKKKEVTTPIYRRTSFEMVFKNWRHARHKSFTWQAKGKSLRWQTSWLFSGIGVSTNIINTNTTLKVNNNCLLHVASFLNVHVECSESS